MEMRVITRADGTSFKVPDNRKATKAAPPAPAAKPAEAKPQKPAPAAKPAEGDGGAPWWTVALLALGGYLGLKAYGAVKGRAAGGAAAAGGGAEGQAPVVLQ